MRLKNTFGLLVSLATITVAAAAKTTLPAAGWTPLLDQKLSQWEIFMGVPHGSLGLPGVPADSDGKKGQPLGLNNDPLHVFTARTLEGEPVLHISGQMFGGLTSLKSYEGFHLRTQFRWGTNKFAPRLKQPRDNGILYRCYGPHGTFWNVWKHSLECQVQEKEIGDFYALGGNAKVACRELPAGGTNTLWHYTPGEPLRLFNGRCAHGEDYHELPNGEWNTIEVIAVGDRSLHLLNGKVVNVLQNAIYSVAGKTQPLVAGQIQIQSEGAECEYRRMEIRELTTMPSEYQALFTSTNAPAHQP